MAKGVYRITVVSAILPANQKPSTQQVFVKLQLGPQQAISHTKGPKPEWNQVHLFQCISDEKLEVSLYHSEKDQRTAYSQVLLTPLLKIPNTRHQITIHSVYRDKLLAINDVDPAPTIEIEIYYTEIFKGTLEIKVVNAQLLRDTEAVGKMDPYVIAKIEGQQVKTSVKQQAGKNPHWDEMLEISVVNPSAKLQLEVKDEDVTIDDQIGKVTVDLRKEGFLKLGPQFVSRKLRISFQEVEAGWIQILTRFTINKEKKKMP